jgi:glyoxylase I family protein
VAAVEFHHVAIVCRDPIASERWYTKHFGFRRARVAPLGDGDQIVFLKAGTAYLELFRATQPSPSPEATGAGPEYPGWRHLAFKVDDVDAKLAEMGDDARITLGPLDMSQFIPGMRAVWLADPEGNIVELNQGYVDEENPPPLDPT